MPAPTLQYVQSRYFAWCGGRIHVQGREFHVDPFVRRSIHERNTAVWELRTLVQTTVHGIWPQDDETDLVLEILATIAGMMDSVCGEHPFHTKEFDTHCHLLMLRGRFDIALIYRNRSRFYDSKSLWLEICGDPPNPDFPREMARQCTLDSLHYALYPYSREEEEGRHDHVGESMSVWDLQETLSGMLDHPMYEDMALAGIHTIVTLNLLPAGIHVQTSLCPEKYHAIEDAVEQAKAFRDWFIFTSVLKAMYFAARMRPRGFSDIRADLAATRRVARGRWRAVFALACLMRLYTNARGG